MDKVRVLYDWDLDAITDMGELVEVIRKALLERAAGRLLGPPRFLVDFGPGNLAFTIGGRAQGGPDNGLAGFRVYSNFGQEGPDWPQIAAIWNTDTAQLLGLIMGEKLGALRTGAIGGCAADLMARKDATSVGMVGAGRHAETQLMAMCAVRPITSAKVFSRTPGPREAFCEKMTAKLGIPVQAVGSAEEAVVDTDIVIGVTIAREPVFRKEWIKPGAHISALGHKMVDAHEMPVDLCEAADLILTDAIDHTRQMDAKHFLRTSSAWDRIGDLAAVAAGQAPGRTSEDQLTLFLSVGLAGTEVFCGEHLLGKAPV